LDDWTEDDIEMGLASASNWDSSTVKIRVPCDGVKCPKEDAPEFSIPGIYHRDIVQVITELFQEPGFKQLHLTPFTQWWQPFDDRGSIKVYGEIYTSEAMLEAQVEVNQLPIKNPEHARLERVVVPLNLYTDSTHVAQFSTASLWPSYVSIGNQSKYNRAKPSKFSMHHIAYFPSISLV
jgi:hypothetical protein